MTDSLCAVRRNMLEAIELHGNENGPLRDLCIDAIASRRPAYWTSIRHHSAISLELCQMANRWGLSLAIDDLPRHVVRAHGTKRFIDTLIPLNIEAEREISLAREGLL